MNDAEWQVIAKKHNLPPAPGPVISARWVAGRDDWYVQTKSGWYWLDKKSWVSVPLGPL